MSYKFTKTHVEHFEITNVGRNFMKYSSFSRVRKDRPKCELCEEKFKPEDNLNLAFVTNKRNHIICNTCANEAIDGGAKETDMRRN